MNFQFSPPFSYPSRMND